MKKTVCLLAILLSSCAPNVVHQPTSPIDEINEAVFRHAFSYYQNSMDKKNFEYFFISIDQNDPNAKFLSRFKTETPAVVSKSLSKINCEDDDLSGNSYPIKNINNGKSGVFVDVFQPKKISDTKYKISWNNVTNCLGGGGHEGVIELINGKWVVTLEKPTWISRCPAAADILNFLAQQTYPTQPKNKNGQQC